MPEDQGCQSKSRVYSGVRMGVEQDDDLKFDRDEVSFESAKGKPVQVTRRLEGSRAGETCWRFGCGILLIARDLLQRYVALLDALQPTTSTACNEEQAPAIEICVRFVFVFRNRVLKTDSG
ncbi:hypothetical protein GUJ93_ZPchr0009g1142 [Zizania palustris]|uniref:Uncharacterized protein n=1 Tax=Zizania palustris TaxID=103762 RepID=A0A8J5RKJ3_ZIZPA|nr:hypothetical protein GUJ93_ZPchr0009g1142 [Zizania palustris]